MIKQKQCFPENNVLELKVRFLRIPLSQISLDINKAAARLQSELHYLSRHCPIVREPALPYLQLLQPIMVTANKVKSMLPSNQSYQLIAGLRTFQLYCEHSNRQKKCKILCIDGLSDQDIEYFQVLDSVAIKLLQHPSDIDIAWIAKTLKENKKLRKRVDMFLPVANDDQLAKTMGMGRTNLTEKIQISRLWMQQLQRAAIKPSAVKINLFGTADGVAE